MTRRAVQEVPHDWVPRGNSWHLMTLLDQAPGFGALSRALIELADAGQPVVVGTADLKYSNGLVRFQERHPDRFIQFGISEQNMVSAAAGLAASGMRPYVATFASFLALLACEQIRTDVAYGNLPVRLIGHHAGISLGFYGTSHHATEDIAIMRSIPNMTVVAPADARQLYEAVHAYADHPGPVYFRIGRGRDPVVYEDEGHPFELGRAVVHGVGTDATLIATGSMVAPALGAARSLCESGLDIGVVDMHTLKPLDTVVLDDVAKRSKLLLTVEEHARVGGLGGAVAEHLSGVPIHPPLVRHGMPDEFSLIGPPTHLYRHYQLDEAGIAAVVRRASEGL